ncbi:MAG: hypothetical protein KC503_31075 [Myxococcales bacterium]|nr:hypothetical protein [Myxococcales bacterium]
MMRLSSTLALVAMLAACGGAPIPQTDNGQVTLPDSGSGDAKSSGGGWRFVPQDVAPQPGQPRVHLQLVSIEGDRATLAVIVDNVAQIQGVAYRLSYNRERVSVADAVRGKVWQGAQVVDRFKQMPNGELWVGIGHVGVKTVPGGQGVTVSTISLDLIGDDPLPIHFQGAYSRVLTPEGVADAVYAGGRFEK